MRLRRCGLQNSWIRRTRHLLGKTVPYKYVQTCIYPAVFLLALLALKVVYAFILLADSGFERAFMQYSMCVFR